MDAAALPEELLARARGALQARRALLSSLLRQLLVALRAALTTANARAPRRYRALSHALRLARVARDARHAVWLPLSAVDARGAARPQRPPRPQQQPQQQQHAPTHPPPLPASPRPPTRFQTRTTYRGLPLDERRAPVAPWAMSRCASSLSVAASTGSVDTLESVYSGASMFSVSSPRPYPYGYASYRVDAVTVAPLWRSAAVRVERSTPVPPKRFFESDEEALEIVRLRDNVFEIGRDGRIRRQKKGIGLDTG